MNRLSTRANFAKQSTLQWLKDPPGFASPPVLLGILDRIEFIHGLAIPDTGVRTLHPDMRRRIAMLVHRYSTDSLFGDFPTDKRRAYLKATVDRIVIHITAGGPGIDGTISWFQNPASKVSSHYIVGRDGEVVQMVRNADTAYHASSANSRR